MTRMKKRLSMATALAAALTLTACDQSSDDSDWTIYAKVSTESGNSNPHAFINASGNILVVWEQYETEAPTIDTDIVCGRSNILAKTYNASNGNWSSETVIQTTQWRHLQTKDTNFTVTGLYADVNRPLDTELKVAMDDAGNATAIWVQDVVSDCATNNSVLKTAAFHSIYDSTTGTWSTATGFVESDAYAFLQNAQDIELAMNNDGEALAAWTQSEYFGLDEDLAIFKTDVIYGASFDGSSWSTAQPLSDIRDGDLSDGDSQSPLVIWVDNNHTMTTGDDTTYSTPLYYKSARPAVAINANGNGIATWKQLYCFPDPDLGAGKTDCRQLTRQEREGEGATDAAQNRFLIHARRFSAGTGWTAATTASSRMSTGSIAAHVAENGTQCISYDTDNPSTAIDDSGNAWVAWEQLTTTIAIVNGLCSSSSANIAFTRNVYINSIASNNTIGTPALLQADDATTATVDESAITASHVQLAATASGQVMAVWVAEQPFSSFRTDLETATGVSYNNRWRATTVQSVWYNYFDGTNWAGAKTVEDRASVLRYSYGEDVPALNILRVTPVKNVKTLATGNGFTVAWQRRDDPRADAGFRIKQRDFSGGAWSGDITSINSGGSIEEYNVTRSGSRLGLAWTHQFNTLSDSATEIDDRWNVTRTTSSQSRMDVGVKP